MPRFGQGKPMDVQAERMLSRHLSLSSRHEAKQALGIPGARSTGQIHSLRTFEKYTQALAQAGRWARETHGVRHLDQITPAQGQQYLAGRAAAGIGQKQLDADRNALQFVTGKDSLERVQAAQKPELAGRAYTAGQAERIAQSQNDRNALATRLAHSAGLRAHELHTLRPAAGQDGPSGHRQWSSDRFLGRDGERYLVIGKGGLVREVLVPRDLARQLEARRIAPERVTDRGVHYTRHYDVGGGNAWSKSFSGASKRELGWSTGAHGLRHAYAQERLGELQAQGLGYADARETLSQELGHFREDVVETYLR
jgi:integrase